MNCKTSVAGRVGDHGHGYDFRYDPPFLELKRGGAFRVLVVISSFTGWRKLCLLNRLIG
jgi:hypothetical protein